MVKKNMQAGPTHYATLKSPIITEKSAGQGLIVMEVDKRADKHGIKSAVERVFNVEVESVRTCNIMGKPKRKGMKSGRTAGYKKAYVTLKEGYKVDLIEGV